MENLQPQEQRNTKRVTIKLDPDGVRTEVEVNLNCKFWELMRKCSQVFNLKLSEFHILTKQGPLPERVYNDYMKDYDLKEVTLERVPLELMEKDFPSYVIGYHHADVFLDVLRVHDDAITNEAVSLIELLQINPKVKAQLSGGISKLRNVKTSPEG